MSDLRDTRPVQHSAVLWILSMFDGQLFDRERARSQNLNRERTQADRRTRRKSPKRDWWSGRGSFGCYFCMQCYDLKILHIRKGRQAQCMIRRCRKCYRANDGSSASRIINRSLWKVHNSDQRIFFGISFLIWANKVSQMPFFLKVGSLRLLKKKHRFEYQ